MGTTCSGIFSEKIEYIIPANHGEEEFQFEDNIDENHKKKFEDTP